MNPAMTIALGFLLEAVDHDKPMPPPCVGENVPSYWIRVIKYQAWQEGHDAGHSNGSFESEGSGPNTWYPYTNPYEEP